MSLIVMILLSALYCLTKGVIKLNSDCCCMVFIVNKDVIAYCYLILSL